MALFWSTFSTPFPVANNYSKAQSHVSQHTEIPAVSEQSKGFNHCALLTLDSSNKILQRTVLVAKM